MAPATVRHWAEALEPRLLHSADLSPLLLGAAALPVAEHQALLDSTTESTNPSPTTTGGEIVFIDATLPDAGTLLADLHAQQAAGRPLEVVLLHSGEDGLAVIGRTLEGRSGLAAIHLIGHGADGRLSLGAMQLDSQTVLQRAGELAAWQAALAPDADLLIYGCDVAAGSAGRALVADLAALTGADVAASSDLTGAAAAGGDWVLEVHSGRIETLMAPSVAAQQAYAGTLAVETTRTESSKSGSAVGSLSWQHGTDAGPNRLLVVQLVVSSQLSSTAVSYGGQALTLLARQDSTLLLGDLRTEVWYLVAPTVGSAEVTVTSSIDANIVAGSISFRNVDQASPFGPVARDAGNNSSFSVSVAAASGDVVIDVIGSKGVEERSNGSGQTTLWRETQGDDSGDLWGSASRENGATSVTMSQRLEHEDGAKRGVYIAVAVKQAGANAAPVIASNGGAATAALTVAENNTAVATVTATDAENGTLSYSISGGADAARFVIDANTGVLRFAAAPDAESRGDADADNVYEVTVQVSDGSLTDSQALAVTVADVNEYAISAAADADAGANQVLESAAIGSSVGVTARATDADASNNSVSYSLSDNAGGRFSIDAASGVVRVAAALDREAAASHSIVVRAASSDGSSQTRAFTIALLDSDEFDAGPVTDNDAAANAVNETAGLGSVVGITARASDADATQNTITYSLDDSAGGRFSIDAATGVLRVAGALDYETAASHAVIVRATSADGSISTNTFTVSVNDIGEAGVGTITDSDAAPNSVDENLAAGAATGLVAQASDPDAGDSISYSLLDDAGGRFTIDTLTGAVRSAAVLDAEAGSSWDIVVGAASSDGSSTQQTFTLAVRDSDEFDVGAPVDIDGAANVVDEDAAIGSSVGVQAATADADAGSNAISYSLTDNAGGLFAIDASSGRISVAAALDRETAASHTITVQALSADGSSALTSFTIAIGDVNEYFVAAISDSDGAPNVVGESAAVGTPVGITAAAADADASNNTIAYSLLDDAGGRFAIDAASGVVSVAGALDFEAATSHRITVRALSSDGSSTSADYTIGIGAANDNTPVFASAAAPLVTENTSGVISVSASDADLPAPDLFYAISGGADAALFSIDAASGALRFIAAPDFEQALDADRDNRYQVEVTASDGSRSAIQGLVVTVADADEAPRLSSHAGAASVNIGTVEGSTAVTAVAATDPEGSALSYRISGGADSALFAIDAGTGLLRWLDAPDFEAPADNGADNVYDVSVAASDGVHDTLQSFSIRVADHNEAPVPAQQLADQAASEDTPFTLTLPGAAFSDVDAGDTLTYSVTQSSGAALPSWLAFDAATRTFSGTPDNADVGSLTLRVQATDTAGAAAFVDFALVVANSNDAPTAALPLTDKTAAEDGSFSLALPAGAFTDVDAGDVLTLHATQSSGAALPSWLTFDAATRTFSGTPGNADVGSLALRVQAIDTAGASVWQDFTLTVANSNDAPLAGDSPAAQTATEGERFEFALPTDTLVDPDSGDRLQFTAQLASGQSLPAWLSFDAERQVFSGTPLAADRAVLVVRIVATDASGAQAFTELTIVVQAPPAQTLPVIEAPIIEAPVVAPAPAPAVVTPQPEPEQEPASSEEAPAPEAPPTPVSMPERPPELLAPALPVADTAVPGNAAPASPAAAPQRGSGHGSAADAVLAPAVLPQFATLGTSGSALSAWLQGGEMQRNHEALQQQLQEAAAQRRAAMASGVAISGGLSIGYVVWLVRGGVLMSSMLSTLPAWKMLDPLPVLAAATISKARNRRKDADADDVERLFDEGAAKPGPRQAQPQAQHLQQAAADKTPEEIEK